MTQVRIEQWTGHDLDLVVAMNALELMTELGGPETDEKLVERHNRYFSGWERGTSWMFRIMVGDEKVGGAGFWTTERQGEDVYETGWTVLGAFQGRGVASAAVALVLEQAAKSESGGTFTPCRRSRTRHPMRSVARLGSLCSGPSTTSTLPETRSGRTTGSRTSERFSRGSRSRRRRC